MESQRIQTIPTFAVIYGDKQYHLPSKGDVLGEVIQKRTPEQRQFIILNALTFELFQIEGSLLSFDWKKAKEILSNPSNLQFLKKLDTGLLETLWEAINKASSSGGTEKVKSQYYSPATESNTENMDNSSTTHSEQGELHPITSRSSPEDQPLAIESGESDNLLSTHRLTDREQELIREELANIAMHKSSPHRHRVLTPQEVAKAIQDGKERGLGDGWTVEWDVKHDRRVWISPDGRKRCRGVRLALAWEAKMGQTALGDRAMIPEEAASSKNTQLRRVIPKSRPSKSSVLSSQVLPLKEGRNVYHEATRVDWRPPVIQDRTFAPQLALEQPVAKEELPRGDSSDHHKRKRVDDGEYGDRKNFFSNPK